MSAPIVETSLGKLQGKAGHGVSVFLGVPYAAPPTGERRFAPPEPSPPWTGVRDATAVGPVAPQLPSPLETLLGSRAIVWDEAACLSLNVWTPGTDTAERPVMVWVHGGAFLNGSSGIPWYDGSRLARENDVVIVTVNYRLGALGFLHLEDVAGPGLTGSGLAGILDQVAALRWVEENISAFGGDPGNVTVFGESAGGMSVATLLALESARGLFHRAVLQSGAGHNAHTREDADRITHEFLQALELTSAGAGTAARLRDLPVSALLEAQGRIGQAYVQRGLAFQPVIDGTTLRDLPVRRVAAGSAHDVAVLVGTNRDEWNLFAAMDPRSPGLDDAGLLDIAVGVFGDGARAEAAIAQYRSSRPDDSPGRLLSAMTTDNTFRIPAIRLAEAQREAGGAAWMYLFTWPSPVFDGRLGACHAVEIPFVFNNLDRPGADIFVGPDAPTALAKAMSATWAAFARSGDPSGGALGPWPQYEPRRRTTMVFDVTPHLEEDPMAAERLQWDGVK
ncbi:MAG TPA: carboxylesterase/lipase family protein [Acidimicrobiales bacterium]|nr:carboxylesterase/lipase family protein [Acidimicrobiales bacterium]